MEARLTRPEGSGGTQRDRSASRRGERAHRIEGSYRAITTHQLALAWWLHGSGHLTRRQLRVYFALHEMAEKRRYGPADCTPLYTVDEVMRLVGGRGGGPKARSEITVDLNRLRTLALAELSDHSIAFARSADQIRIDDLSGFWTMFEHIPNRRRTVPVPRRMLRALAAGFSKATTALVIAMLIRGLFWHKETGDYRTDGRYKLSWVAEVFGISRRAVTDARSTLIDLGWLEPLEVSQIMMNRYGLHDRIVADWKRPDPAAAVGEQAETGPFPSAESASPNAGISARSASLYETGSLSLKGDQLNTRKPAPTRAGPTGVSPTGSTGSRKRESWRSPREPKSGPPSIRDIRASDLASTERLIELHRQACAIGLSSPSEAGRIAFLSLAERARSRGSRAGALFFWLLRERKYEFITQHDEDEASRRIRELHNGPSVQPRQEWGGEGQERPEQDHELTDDERFVVACTRAAHKTRNVEPFHVARAGRGWSRERWDDAVKTIEERKFSWMS